MADRSEMDSSRPNDATAPFKDLLRALDKAESDVAADDRKSKGKRPVLKREEKAMPDDKDKRGQDDRALVAGGESYEVRHFAEKHDLTIDQAKQLIATHGNSREALEDAVARMMP